MGERRLPPGYIMVIEGVDTKKEFPEYDIESFYYLPYKADPHEGLSRSGVIEALGFDITTERFIVRGETFRKYIARFEQRHDLKLPKWGGA